MNLTWRHDKHIATEATTKKYIVMKDTSHRELSAFHGTWIT